SRRVPSHACAFRGVARRVYTRLRTMSAFQPAQPGQPVQPAQPADPARFFTGVLADQHYQKGVQFEQQGEWERALAAYRKASSLDAHRVLFLLARGRVCQAHGLEPEAEQCYEVALRLRPDDPVVLYNQAQLFAARGRLDQARANLARIVDGDVDALGDR